MTQETREWPALLPAGLHDTDLQAIEQRCVNTFTKSNARPRIFAGLRLLLQTLREMGLKGEIWLDGSFLTEKPEPSDVDLLFVADSAALAQTYARHAATLEALFSRGEARALYLCDAYCCTQDDANKLSYWRGWFGFFRDGSRAKGIARINL